MPNFELLQNHYFHGLLQPHPFHPLKIDLKLSQNFIQQYFDIELPVFLIPTFRTSLCSTKRYMDYHQNLSQQIKQINSIEHKKISGMSIFGKLGIFVGRMAIATSQTQ